MNAVLPLATTLFYISAGYMLVAGMTAVAVAVVARTKFNKYLYGAFALLSLAGAGHQIACTYYFNSKLIAGSLSHLAVQLDFATLALLASIAFIFCEARRGRRIETLCIGLVVVLVLVLVANHASTFSLHFASIDSIAQSTSWWGTLYFLKGEPSVGTYIWYTVFFALMTLPLFNSVVMWRQTHSHRSILLFVSTLILLGTIVTSFATDLGLVSVPYLIGFGINVLVGIMAVDMLLQSAHRSQQLARRDMQMQGEVRQRRKVEDKLQRLSQVFMQAPSPVHIVEMNGKTIQVNEESVRFLRRDVSMPPKVNFLDMFEQLGLDRRMMMSSLLDGKVKDYGPYYFTAGLPVDSLYLVRDAYLTFRLYPIFDQRRQLKEFVVLMDDVTEKQFVDSAIQAISTAVSTETGHAFFTNLVVHLARLLKTKYVFIGLKTIKEGVEQLETLAVAVDGELGENFSFDLKGTPSQIVLEQGRFSEARGVQEQFGEQAIIQDLGVQSYLGAAIYDQHREAIGVLAILDRKPMDHVKRFLEVVNIFVSRAGTELQRIEAEKKIRKMAYEDFLTGLPNRTELYEHVSNLLEKDKQDESDNLQSAFIQVDLDHFKTINDALGHDIGDEVIRALAHRLAEYAGDNMLISRIGGDEFAIVVSGLKGDVDVAIDNAVKSIVNLLERPVQVGDHLLDVGCTLGVVLFPEFAKTTVDVFRNADTALYKAKASGRGNYHVFTPEMRDAVTKRLVFEKGLRAALQNDEFLLYYQPQIDDVGNLVGAEALIRWMHPEQGLIPPIAFIPVAEETGLISSIGQWVIEHALKARKRWSNELIPFSGHLSVNVSAWQFNRPDFVASTIKLISDAKVPPSHFTLEVTETALLNDIDETIEKLAELRRFGVSIALDDFGTGYSSLAYLRDLPLDVLKIDKAFVDVLETHAHEPLVESMISIGRHMGLKVVAEGVESRIQLERLKVMGCHNFQGYYFSKPMPEAQFEAWLQERASRDDIA